jgi:hypothetical protein
MEMEGEHLRIFYPATGEAFDILTEPDQGLPFVSVFLGSNDEDFGLSRLGYTLEGHEMRQDTLITTWKAPRKAGVSLGSALLARHQERVVRVELLDLRGRRMALYRCSGMMGTGLHI